MNDQNEQTSLALRPQQITPATLQTIQAIAPMAAMFGLSEPQAAIAMLTGVELGLGMMASLGFVDVIKTKKGLRPALRSQAMMALINRSGVLAEFTREDHADGQGNPNGCTITMARKAPPLRHTTTFSQADADRAGLLTKGGAWASYPRAMYYNRALAECARAVCPDVIMGLYTVEETEAMDAEWSVISLAPSPAEPVIQVEVKKGITMTDVLAAGFTAQDVLDSGGIPSTNEEWEIRLAYLIGEYNAELDKAVENVPEIEYADDKKDTDDVSETDKQQEETKSKEEKTDE